MYFSFLENVQFVLAIIDGTIWRRLDIRHSHQMRKFYQAYANASIVATPLPQLESNSETADSKAVVNSSNAVATIQLPRFILSWSHYLILMRIENIEARSFYELECAQQQIRFGTRESQIIKIPNTPQNVG